VAFHSPVRPRYLAIALAYLALYGIAGWAHPSYPFARALAGNIGLLSAAGIVVAVVWRRRRSWAGCQRLFWDMFAIGMTFWIIGHLGWAFDEMIRKEQSWLQWHTVFSLCAGITPLIALLARPHRGTRTHALATTAVDLAASGLLVLFLYSYFVLVPSLVPSARDQAQTKLLLLIQANRLLLLAGLVVAAWFARRSDWRSTYVRLAAGVAIGFIVRIAASLAITRGEYYSGTPYDFAWIAPWLFYAWAALEAPPSRRTDDAIELPEPPSPVAFSVVPVLTIPVIGYGMVAFGPLGVPLDSFRTLLTSMTTVGGLALLTLRLSAQRGALQRADARLKLLASATERTGDMILIIREDGGIEHANDAFLRTTGYTRAEIEHFGIAELGATSAELRREITATVRETGRWRGTLLRRRKGGSTFPSACTIAALRNSAGRITHYVGVERDISEELRLRDQLVHSERLSAIGELVAGVAHEINNPLQTIVGCVELMLDDRSGATNRRDLETVRREAARAGQIVRNLLSFVRRGSTDRAAADLTQIVRATVELREYHLHLRNIKVETAYAGVPLPVLVNRDEIQQVILNLLLNAEHAVASSAEGGTIRIATAPDGAHHIVEVADTGPGVSAELRGRIFEPFFTTKEVGEGTGLGLSISHGIASAHDGSLELRDAGVGACFRLMLPAYQEERTVPSPGEPEGAADVRCALVVDDEEPIRRLLGRLLERRGFEVLEADTGERALELAPTRRFSLVICDIRMPGIDGNELHRRFAEMDPAAARHFVFITGDTTAVQRVSLSGSAAVLPKPFTAADLDAVLARVVKA